MAKVVCAGHVNWDVTLQVDRLPEPDGEARIEEQHQSGGGSASNVAVGLAGLDVPTALLGSIGTDKNGWLARRELTEAGVDTLLVEAEGRQTAVKYLVVDDAGEVMVLGNEGANEAFEAGNLSETALTDADHLHLTSQSPETAATLAQRATDSGLRVSFDPGRRLDEREYDDVLAHADVLFVNDREASIADDSTLLEAAPTVVRKRGSGGATVHTADGEITHPGFAVDSTDTSGAGDAFAAGFIAASFHGSDEYALAVGNACGALATRTVGAGLSVGWRDVEAILDIGPAE